MGMDRRIETKWWMRRRFRWFASIGGGAIVLAVLFAAGEGSAGRRVARDVVRTAPAVLAPFEYSIPLSGTIVPVRSVYLDAVEGGRVERVVRESGTDVAEGDTILVLSNTDRVLDVMNREAQLLEQRGNLGNAKLAAESAAWELRERLLDLDGRLREARRTYDRFRSLAETDLVAPVDLDEARDAYERLVELRDLTREAREHDLGVRREQVSLLEDSVRRLESNLDVLRGTLDQLVVRAPVSGSLTGLEAKVGETKVRGERLGQVDVLEGFLVRAEVDEFYISRVTDGLTGRIETDAGEFVIRVRKIYPEVRDGRFRVELEFADEAPRGLRRGQTMKFRLSLGEPAEAITLPRGAFYDETGGRWVFVVDPSGEVARRRDVRLGRQNSRFVEVLEGLEPGEEVIVSSYRGFEGTESIRLVD